MTSVIPTLGVSSYRDRKFQGTDEDWDRQMAISSTLYVGNLSFYTTEEQIYELFSKCGPVKRVIMGLDRNTKTPCGFCFVEYDSRLDALDCVRFLSGTKLDERIIRTDIDPGFVDGRQFGRGRSGGQVRDEYRQEYDSGRGGWGVQEKDKNEPYIPTGQVDYFGRSIELRNYKRLRQDEPTKRYRDGNRRFRESQESD